jgi:hypothetical protein
MLLISELSVRPAIVLLCRASPGVSQTPNLGRRERPTRREVVGHELLTSHLRERAARFVRRLRVTAIVHSGGPRVDWRDARNRLTPSKDEGMLVAHAFGDSVVELGHAANSSSGSGIA